MSISLALLFGLKRDETYIVCDVSSKITKTMMDNLGNMVARGAIWMVAMRLAVRLVGMISTLILVRLLGPSDFGVVAMVMTVVATIDTLREFGFEVTLIQNQKTTDDDYNTVWTMDVILAAVSAVIIVLVAEPAARFYSEPSLVSVFYVIAVANVIHGFQNIGIVNFRKNLDFDREFRFAVLTKSFGFVVTISCAFLLRSYWALVIGIVSLRIASVALSYVMHGYRPRFSLSKFGNVFSFSKWLFVHNVSSMLRFRIPDFIIGRIAGTTGLGLFSLSYEISNLPTSEITAPVNRALLPGFSKLSGDSARASRAFVRVAAVMALFSFPIAFGIAATADLIGVVILGEKWLDAIPLLKVLAFCGGITAIMSPIGSALIALGRPKVIALLSACNAAVLIPAIIYSMKDYGVLGASKAMLISLLVFLPIYLVAAARYIEITLDDVFTIFFRPTFSAVAMYFVVSEPLIPASSAAINLLASIVVGAIAYTCITLLLWSLTRRAERCAETYLLGKFLGTLRRTRLSTFAGQIEAWI